MIGAAFVLGANILMAGPGPGQGVCVSLDLVPRFLRSPGETQLVARVVEGRPWDTVPHPTLPWPGPWHPRGQRIVIEQADGPGATRLDTDSVAVVAHRPTNSPVCNSGVPYDSLVVGTRHVFMATLRPDSLWLDGHPTWDIRPELLADFTAPDSAAVATYQRFLATLPSRTEWKADCRPGVERVERWLDAHGEATSGYPIRAVRTGLREICHTSLQYHAWGLERWKRSQDIPDALRAIYKDKGCRDDAGVMTSVEDAVDGTFVASGAPQWALVCPRNEDWLLLVVVLESPPRVIELLRMVGKEWSWVAGTAAAGYFRWATSRDFRLNRWGVARPDRGVVLLTLLWSDDDDMLAFYETRWGWTQVGVECCYWPD